MLAHFCGSSIQWWLTVGALSFAKRLGFFGCAVCVFVLCAYGMESVRGCPLFFLPDSEPIGTPKAPFLLHVWPSKSLQHISGRTLMVGRFRDRHNTPSETRVEGTIKPCLHPPNYRLIFAKGTFPEWLLATPCCLF